MTTTEPTYVWVVTKGEYDDYRMVAVFATEELARDVAGQIPSSDYPGVEKMPLLTSLPQRVERWSVWLDHNDRVWKTRKEDRWDFELPFDLGCSTEAEARARAKSLQEGQAR